MTWNLMATVFNFDVAVGLNFDFLFFKTKVIGQDKIFYKA